MDAFNRLEELFTYFPGIGPRQARRFVYYLLSRPESTIRELTQLIDQVKKSSRECDKCHRFFVNAANKAVGALCAVCADTNRDQSQLMIVARDSDFESIEKSGAYKGYYFIMGGTVPILDKDPEKRIRLRGILERLSSSTDIKEVILSLNTTPDGENTETIIKDAIRNIAAEKGLKVSILGRGLSTGAELEYTDQSTIKNALQNRH